MKEYVFSSPTWTKRSAITWFAGVGTVWIVKNIVSEGEVGELCLGCFASNLGVLVSSRVPLGC